VDFSALTVQMLKSLADIAGSYGLAIVLVTVVIRLALWPLSVSQQRSMLKTQQLAPKLKEIQDRYKSNPEMMQRKIAEFYKEHSFNPFAGCFPLLIQMPVFIMLYSALISPQFIELAGKSSFLFIKRLDAPMRSHAGIHGDKIYGVESHDTFSAPKQIIVYLKDNKKQEIELKDPRRAIKVQGDIVAGKPIDLKINTTDEIKMPFEELDQIQKAEIHVINNSTKETEDIVFNKRGDLLVASVDTVKAKTQTNYDVLVLIILFGITMYFSQKAMTLTNKNKPVDPAQQAMQDSMGKIMPFMITGMFFFMPLPAGVLLYMVVSNVIQVIQTVVINKQLEAENPKKPDVIDIIASEPKSLPVQDDKTDSKKSKKN